MNKIPSFYTMAPNEGAHEIEDDGFYTVEFPDATPKPLEGYPPGHYKSWNGDIPDVERE